MSIEKEYILFGAGSGIEKFIKKFKNLKIKYIVDNDKKKWGSFINGIEVKNPINLINEKKNNISVIITSSYYKKIEIQLENIGFEKSKDFIYGLKFLEEYDLKQKQYKYLNEEEYIVNKEVGQEKLNFYCPSKIALSRVERLYTKEPETIEWINGFEKDIVFWDIGANVGIYSLYAAFTKNSKVLAFEPAAVNYYVLTKNIEINRLDKKIYPLCMAFDEKSKLGCLNMTNTNLGGALHSFGKPQQSIGIVGEDCKVEFKQGMLGFSIDEFISLFTPHFPNHIKIDVDGIEDKIIDGATQTLRNTQLKSVLIELDTQDKEYCKRVITKLENSGLKLVDVKHAEMYDSGKFSSMYNHIFVRK